MSKVLIESRMNSLRLCESDSKPRKGCLGRIEGTCADFEKPTRNGRFYPKELWENVFNSELVKEALETKTLIGELDHPEDRFEPLAQEACVVMTDYEFDNESKTLKAGFDILDTQKGRILKALLDYGCVMGVSSRGQGDTILKGEYEEVDPSTYEFACFDVVLTPAVKSARQSVVESAGKNKKIKSLEESIIKEIDKADSLNALNNIKSIVEGSNIANTSEIISAIDKKCDSFNNTEGETISSKLKEELHDAKIEINRLQRKLQEQEVKTINERKNLQKAAADLSTQNLAYQYRESRLSQTLGESKAKVKSLKREVLENEKEISRVKHDYSEERAKAKDLQLEVEKVNRANEHLNISLKEEKAKVEQLQQKTSIEESELSKIKENLENKDSEIINLRSEIENLKSDNSKLIEKLEREKESNKKAFNESVKLKEVAHQNQVKELAKQLSSVRESYISLIAQQNGLNESLIRPLIAESMTPSDINKVIIEERKRMDRYNELPFANITAKPTAIVESSMMTSLGEDGEYKTSQKFMEQVAGIE